MKDFNGRTALVTGGASGIGRCIALDLVREGCTVALVDLNEGGLEAVAAEVRRSGGTATTHRVDVSDARRVEELAGEVRPQLLVNCAGTGILADLEDTTDEEFRRIVEVNLFGPVSLVRAFLPALRENGGGHVVNIASGFGLTAFPGFGAYSTSKFGLVGYSEVLSMELAKYGIKVTTVCPGITDTPILEYSEMRGFADERARRFVRRLLPLVGTTPEKLSAVVISAIKRDRYLVTHTWMFRLLLFVKRVSPRLYRDMLSFSYKAAGRLR